MSVNGHLLTGTVMADMVNGYFKSQDLSLSVMVIEDFLLQDINYGTVYLHL